MKKLRIAVDARLTSGDLGGVEQVLIGLASGLSELGDGDEKYFFLAYSDSDQWLQPYVHGPVSIVHVGSSRLLAFKRRIRTAFPRITKVWDRCRYTTGLQSTSNSDLSKLLEVIGADIIHFPIQSAFQTNLPSIYHPHDLQHIHLPNYFSPITCRVREFQYRKFCNQAKIVAVSSTWVKEDVSRQYNLPPDKVKVVPLAPPLQAYNAPSENYLIQLRRKHSLPDEFLLYPAQTWPHKNHIALLDALAILRDRYGLNISFVSCGKKNEYYRTIQAHINKLNLAEQVHFLGYISNDELYGLYKLSRAVVIPTLFEAASFPIWEAFHAGTPVACSNVTSLPEQAEDAAIYFNPNNPDEIADSVRRLWIDEVIRSDLVSHGYNRLSKLSWNRSARIFRAHYRYLAGKKLTAEDVELRH